MYTQISVNKDIICTIYCHWELQRPRTWHSYFRSFIFRYPKILRYSVRNNKNYTYNDATKAIIDILKMHERHTKFDIIIPVVNLKITKNYRSQFDLREIASKSLTIARDFYTDQILSREERGDPELDNLTVLKPLGI